jgi:hypothetical protein
LEGGDKEGEEVAVVGMGSGDLKSKFVRDDRERGEDEEARSVAGESMDNDEIEGKVTLLLFWCE